MFSNFFKGQKTNWRYLFAIIVLAAFAGGMIFSVSISPDFFPVPLLPRRFYTNLLPCPPGKCCTCPDFSRELLTELPLLGEEDVFFVRENFRPDADALKDIILPYLNRYPDNPEVLKKIKFSSGLSEPISELVKWIKKADLDNDKADEVMLVYEDFNTNGWFFPEENLVLLAKDFDSERSEEQGSARAGSHNRFPENSVINLASSQQITFSILEDVNLDGKIEFAFITEDWGANTSWDAIFTIQWDGKQYKNISEGVANSFATIEWIDENNDGIKEISVFGGHEGGVKAQCERGPDTAIYTYSERNGKYEVSRIIEPVVTDIYLLMIDANHALEKGEYDKALEITTKAFANSNEFCAGQYCGENCAEAEEQKEKIFTYITIEAILAHLKKTPPQIKEAEVLFQNAKKNYSNNFISGLDVLWQTYSTTKDTQKACEAMETEIQKTENEHLADSPSILSIFGYYPEGLDGKDLCPFNK